MAEPSPSRPPLLCPPATRSALAARVRYFAAELVFSAQLGYPASYLARQRALLSSAVGALMLNYQSVIRGNATQGLPVGELYANAVVGTLLFDRVCLRKASGCFPGAGDKDGPHPWHWRTTSGLDTLLRQFAAAAESLVRDPDSALTTDNDDFLFVWLTGASDVHDGLSRLGDVFRVELEDKFLLVKLLLIIPIPIMAVMMFVFFRRMFMPWLKRARKESFRVAELLSQLPRELNVEALLLEAMGQGKKEEEEEKKSTMDDEAQANAAETAAAAGSAPLAPLAARSRKLGNQIKRKVTKKMSAISSQAIRMLREGGTWAEGVHGAEGADLRDTDISDPPAAAGRGGGSMKSVLGGPSSNGLGASSGTIEPHRSHKD